MAEAETGASTTSEQQEHQQEQQQQGEEQRAGEEQLGDAGKRAIQAEREARAAAEKAARDAQAKLKEIEDAQKSEEQKRQEAADAALKEAEAAKAKALRYEVAAAKGVPLTQAHRLQGATKEDLEADAEAFLKDLHGGNGTPDFEGGTRTTAGKGDFDSQIRGAR